MYVEQYSDKWKYISICNSSQHINI